MPYNQRLSERRATVKNHRLWEGRPAGIIQASGQWRVAAGCRQRGTAAGRAQNRRVEITVEVTQ